ncbi:ATP-binding cassette domain-containing protein [Streptomyces sp. NPDC101132]|uniref:ATP-binding cassette domain-containing protein n=1 Tax=Streptomyces sp. NPDC101132 TaxID=3366110 RepID=UPI00381E68DB
MTHPPRSPEQGSSGDRAGNAPAHLRIHGLVVAYGSRTVLDIPALSLGTGITALTGANGSGKTTLLKTLALLIRPTTGTVELEQDGGAPGPRTALRRHRAAVGFLPQAPEFPGHFTVRDAVTYSAWLRGIPRARRAEAVHRVVEDLNLTAAATTPLRALSGGNRQRAHIAQALVHDPSVVLLDEPTTGIDIEHRIALREHLARAGQTRCIVMSTHHTEDVELLADRVVSLRDGQVVFDGTPEQLMARASNGTPAARSIERALHDLGGANT